MIKWIKGLIDKRKRERVPVLVPPEWGDIYTKSPIHAETVTANIIINAAELKYIPDGYIADSLAALIAQELVRRDLIAIEQPDAEDPDKRAFTGKIKIVLRG